MPDWSYRTLFRPLLFQLSSEKSRDVTLGLIGGLSKLPGGSLVIRTLGHMESSPVLAHSRYETAFKYPVGLCGGLDPHGQAQKALAQFGFGFMEVGPVSLRPIRMQGQIGRDPQTEVITYPNIYENDGLESIHARFQPKSEHPLPIAFRTRHMEHSSLDEAIAEQLRLMTALAPHATSFHLDWYDERWTDEQAFKYIRQCLRQAAALDNPRSVLLYMPADLDPAMLSHLMREALDESCAGIVCGDAVRAQEGYVVGRDAKPLNLRQLQTIKDIAPQSWSIIASGGIHEPNDALELMQAGADLVMLHSGLVFAGPGLPKRVNDAIIYESIAAEPPPAPPSFFSNWGWMCLLGLGMIIGGVIAWYIAATSVVLPYDLTYLCVDRNTLSSLNDRLLPFMSHDRVTLAGTMISIGIVYFMLGKVGLRRRLHWARTALLVSGIVGFISFFLYLGYGYFDPLHGMAAILLLPLFLLAMRNSADSPSYVPPNRFNDRLWRRALWGQLMLVALGFALAIGGLTIAFVGVTDVFVPQDLDYMQTSALSLMNWNERLLPLIAHDRAGFGGALLSLAIALLASALWGIAQGERWLWWSFLIGGLPALIAALGIHGWIGYTDLLHLSPAFVAVGLYVVGLILLYPYMMNTTTKAEHTQQSLNA